MKKRALVVGLGIAGMAAAIGLAKAGWMPVVIERSRERRTGGYFVGLFPEGRRAAVELGIADHLHIRNPERKPEGNTWSIDRRGRRAPGLGFLDQPGDPAAVLRGDIEAALWHGISAHAVEVRFGTTVTDIRDAHGAVETVLENSATGARSYEEFDLVVGADGMRSSVRRIVFGPHEDHLKNWDAMICAFRMTRQVPSFGASDSIIDAQPRRAAWVFGFADHPPTALLTYRTRDIEQQFAGSHIDQLRHVFAGMDGPVVTHVLDELDAAPEILFDSVHQVRMPRWSAGRVVLVGDAAWCLNLYSGMGASSALRGGAALGSALHENPDDLTAGLDAWEAGLRPFITAHRRTARIKQQLFVPSGPGAAVVRAGALRMVRAIRQRQVGNDGRFSHPPGVGHVRKAPADAGK